RAFHVTGVQTCALPIFIGHLLAAPPPHGELGAELDRLAAKRWRHPVTGQPATFGRSTIEHWYYVAKNAPLDPVGRLRKKARKDRSEERRDGQQVTRGAS